MRRAENQEVRRALDPKTGDLDLRHDVAIYLNCARAPHSYGADGLNSTSAGRDSSMGNRAKIVQIAHEAGGLETALIMIEGYRKEDILKSRRYLECAVKLGFIGVSPIKVGSKRGLGS